MASIQKKADRKGRVTHYVVISATGKRKWIRAGTLSAARTMKKEIEALAQDQQREKLGLSLKPCRIDSFFEEYLEYARLRTAPNTVKRYRAAINAFIAYLNLFCPHVRETAQIKTEHIQGFQRRRLESVELKAVADGEKNGVHKAKRLPLPQTVNYEVSVLRSAFMWALDRELIVQVPTRRVKKLRVEPRRPIRILTPEEARLFLYTGRQMASQERELVPFIEAFAFLLNTGLRSGELCNLCWDDVELDNGLLKVRAKAGWTPKTSEREFFLNSNSLALLKRLEKKSEYVFVTLFGARLRTDDLRRRLIRFAREAGISGLTRVHDLRHTFASHLQMNGVDAPTVSRLLGHKSLGMTMVYTHQTAEHLKKSIEKVGIG